MIISHSDSSHLHWRHARLMGSVLVVSSHSHILLHLCNIHLNLRNKLSGHNTSVKRLSINLHRRLSVHDLICGEVSNLVYRVHWGVASLVPRHLSDKLFNSFLRIGRIFIDLADQRLSHLRVCLHYLLHY